VKRMIFSLVIVFMLVMMSCSNTANFPPELQQQADTWPRCSSGCTANDASITYIWLEVDPGCTPGTPTSAQLWATYEVNRANGICCVVTVIDIYVGGNLTEDDYIFPTGNFTSSGTYNVSVANITWICGSVLTLEDIYAQWIDKGGQPCPTCTADCNGYKQPKCYKDAGPYEVHAPLVADFDFNEVCFCNNTTFTDTTTSGVKPYYSWDWDFGDGTAHSSAQNATHHYGSTGTYNVTLTVTDSDSPPNSDSQSYNVTVHTNPTVNITPDGGELTCTTTFIILTADTTGSACTVTSYQWYKDDVALSGETGTTLNVTSPGDYKVEVECVNGCTDDDEVIVTQNITPPEATASSNSPVSQGATIQLYGGPDVMTIYDWTGPDGWKSSDRNPTRTGATTAMAGTYTLIVTNSNGCTDSDDVTVTVTNGCCICGSIYRAGTTEALAGWEVILEKKTNPWVEVQSTITDANGKYCFCGLEDGEYRVSEVVKPNWNQVFPLLPNEHLVNLPGGCCDPEYGPFLNFENEQGPAGPTVGWEVSPIDKLAVLAPWITLFAVIVAGASLLVLRRRRV
jgi:PKD repeat protein